jgi:hypothetical protein
MITFNRFPLPTWWSVTFVLSNMVNIELTSMPFQDRLFYLGDILSADGIIVQCSDLKIDESALTGLFQLL